MDHRQFLIGIILHLGLEPGGGGALPYLKVRYVRLLRTPFFQLTLHQDPLKLCSVTQDPIFCLVSDQKLHNLSPQKPHI